MNILALDLANFSSSLALIVEGKTVFSDHSPIFRGQDVTLIPKIKSVLKEQGLHFEDLTRLVSTRGPGSFTGIRVALATLQGLSFAAGIPAYGVSSFQGVIKMYPHPLRTKTLVLLDSKRLELYGQLFNDSGAAVGEAFSLSPEDIAANPLYQGSLCIGNGAVFMKEHGFALDPFMPQASHLANLALTLPDTNKDHPCLPIYIRDADTGKPKNV